MIIKNITKGLLFLCLLGSASSCTKNYIDINEDPFDATDEDMEKDAYAARAAMVGMQGWVVPLDINQFQFINCLLGGSFSGYLSDSGNWSKKISTYNPTDDWTQPAFNELISNVFIKMTELKNATDDPVILSVGLITKVMALHQVTDIYGPIPYSKVGEGNKLAAPYDTQRQVYNEMFAELDSAIQVLTLNQTSAISPLADKVYEGNVVQWIKLANSLKLRLAMRIAYADPQLSQKKAEEAVNHEIGLIEANSDNAQMPTPNNPFKVIMYDYNDGDSRVGADITSYMNGYEDPRREQYFAKSTFKDIPNGYFGFRNGVLNAVVGKPYANMKVSTTSKLLWMNAAEVAFLRAEGALRGWNMGGSAQTFYEQGITLSFDQWGASGAAAYINNNTNTPKSYVDPLGTYSNSAGVSQTKIKFDPAGGFESQLEQIITQKWIANFPLGLEGWAEYRRTGYPHLMAVVDNLSGGEVNSEEGAQRLRYPETEYRENSENLVKAIESLGGPDNMATKVWWDNK